LRRMSSDKLFPGRVLVVVLFALTGFWTDRAAAEQVTPNQSGAVIGVAALRRHANRVPGLPTENDDVTQIYEPY